MTIQAAPSERSRPTMLVATARRCFRLVPGLVALVTLVASACSCDSGKHLSMPSPSPEPTRQPVLSAMPLPTATDAAPDSAPPPPRYEGNAASVEAKVGEIEALGPDRSEAATTSLLRASESASLLISAAAIRGLTGRGCDRVQVLLVRMLEDNEWQRRAWAAKVLGDNGCREARPALVARSQREQDERVRSRLDEATRRLEEVKK